MPENFKTEELQGDVDLNLEAIPGVIFSEKSRRSVDEMLRRIERTNELEFSLESKEAPEDAQPSQVSRRNFLKIMAIGTAAAVLSGGKSEAEPSLEIKKKYDEMLQKNKEKSEEIIERLGIKADIAEIARKNEFLSYVNIENGAGPYVVHIGQMHKNPVEEESASERDRVIRVQRSIEQAILDLQKSGRTGKGVYSESFTGDEEEKKSLESLISKEKKALWEMEAHIPNYLLLFRQVQKEKNVVYAYLYLQRLRSMSKCLPDINGGDKDKLDQVEAFLTGPQAKKIEDDLYMIGAVLKMFLDENALINPTENTEALEEGLGVIEEEKVKKDSNKPTDGVYTNEQFGKERDIKHEYIKKKQGPVMRTREDIAIEKITLTQDNNDLMLLVFGDGHDFTAALEAYNKANPQKRMGLIKLKSRLCL